MSFFEYCGKKCDMSIGLKKDTVKLEVHQDAWDVEGAVTCKKLKDILGDDIVDAQHVGSTSIRCICAKPIIDIAVAVRDFQDIMKHNEELAVNGIIYRRQDVPGQHLYRCGDLENDIVTHYIHVVIADSEDWHNYINFRDYLNAHPEDAKAYERLKEDLCSKYPEDRNSYVDGKKELVAELLVKAKRWREVQ